MTPQEALAQALLAARVPAGIEGPWRNAVRAETDAIAAAILDALPEPMRRDVPSWVDGWDKGREVGRREGAQQERERLRALVDTDLVAGDPSDYWTQRQVYLWATDDLLADPEDDR